MNNPTLLFVEFGSIPSLPSGNRNKPHFHTKMRKSEREVRTVDILPVFFGRGGVHAKPEFVPILFLPLLGTLAPPPPAKKLQSFLSF